MIKTPKLSEMLMNQQSKKQTADIWIGLAGEHLP